MGWTTPPWESKSHLTQWDFLLMQMGISLGCKNCRHFMVQDTADEILPSVQVLKKANGILSPMNLKISYKSRQVNLRAHLHSNLFSANG